MKEESPCHTVGTWGEGCRQSLAQARCPPDAKCKQERKWLRWRFISGCADGMKGQAMDASEKGTGYHRVSPVQHPPEYQHLD